MWDLKAILISATVDLVVVQRFGIDQQALTNRIATVALAEARLSRDNARIGTEPAERFETPDAYEIARAAQYHRELHVQVNIQPIAGHENTVLIAFYTRRGKNILKDEGYYRSVTATIACAEFRCAEKAIADRTQDFFESVVTAEARFWQYARNWPRAPSETPQQTTISPGR